MSAAVDQIRGSLAELARLPLDEPLARAHLETALLCLARRIDHLYAELGADDPDASDSRGRR